MSSTKTIPPVSHAKAVAKNSRGEQTYLRVLRAAGSCVAEKGYALASSNEIARRAGVSWGVIQHHFGTRQAIMLELLNESLSELEVKLTSVEIEGNTIEQSLTEIVEVIWSYYTNMSHLSYHEVYINLIREPKMPDDTKRNLQQLNDRAIRLWAKLMEPVFGRFKDHAALERLLLHSLWGVALNALLGGGPIKCLEERRLLISGLALELESRTKKSALAEK